MHAGHLDVRDNESIAHFIAAAEAACGAIDILVNAAGTTAEQPVCGHSDDLWNKIIDTNLTGAFRMIRAVLPGMIERGCGRIINIGSTAATVGWKDNPAYCASKHGLLGLTRCVALEGAAHGVTCIIISPTWVETELMHRNVAQLVAREGKGRTAAEAMAEIAAQNPQHRIIQPGEIAALAVFLCSDDAPRHHHGKYPGHRRFLVVILACGRPDLAPSTSPRRGAGSAAWQWLARCAAAPCAQSIPRRHRSSAGSALRRRQKRRPAPRRDRAGDCR